jgi:Glycine rich protein
MTDGRYLVSPFRFCRRAFGIGLAVAILTGCAGVGSPPQQASSASQPAPQFRPIANWLDVTKCKTDQRVSVKPCSVQLDLGHRKATVTTKGPKGGTFTYKDRVCKSRYIATVEGSDNTYLVTGGSFQGVCTVTFIDKESTGKTIGTAALSITNLTRHGHCPPTCQAPVLAPQNRAKLDSETFTCTGAKQTFAVPKGVKHVTVAASGASGSGIASAPAAAGGLVTATIPVKPAELLAIFVGCGGASASGGFNGGADGGTAQSDGFGGGGASDVRQGGSGLAKRVVVAGGGGGGGGHGFFGFGSGGSGGLGGNLIGGDGADGSLYDCSGSAGVGGDGGTQSAGGLGGPGADGGSDGGQGSDAAGGSGGSGTSSGAGGGGGGGGYYGGGGGGGYGDFYCGGGGGGGGGSSFAEAKATHVTMVQGGADTNEFGENGGIVLSWK